MIRVLVIDDHPMIREGLSATLNPEPDMRVTASAVTPSSGTASTPAVAAAIGLQNQAAGSLVLTVTAATGAAGGVVNADPGAWGNNLRVDVDYGTTDPTKQFNLTVTQVMTSGTTTQVVARETYLNLVVDPSQPNDAAATVNAASQLIALTAATGSTGQRPAQNGTASNPITSATTTFTTLGLAPGDTLTISLTNAAGTTAIGSTAGLPTPAPADLGSLASVLLD